MAPSVSRAVLRNTPVGVASVSNSWDLAASASPAAKERESAARSLAASLNSGSSDASLARPSYASAPAFGSVLAVSAAWANRANAW